MISTGNGLDPNFKNAYTQQWNFTIQKKLPRQIYLDAGYVGSKGTRIPIIYDANRPIAIIPAGQTAAPLAQRRPFLGWDTINIDKSVGSSTYHSLQVKVERRISPGLSILGAYTWSKALTNADTSGNIGAGTYIGPLQDYMNLAGARSYAVFDIAHRLSTAVIYDLPLFRSSSQRVPGRGVRGGGGGGVRFLFWAVYGLDVVFCGVATLRLILLGLDLAEVDREAVGEEQQVAGGDAVGDLLAQTSPCFSSGSRIITRSPRLAASAMSSTSSPAASALARLEESGRRPTTTSTPSP